MRKLIVAHAAIKDAWNYGLRSMRVLVSADDQKSATLETEWSTVDVAKAFAPKYKKHCRRWRHLER